MKYCGRYSNKIDMSVFDEITIRYNGQNEELVTFLQEHSAQKVTLVVHDIGQFYTAKSWEVINAIHETYPEWDFNVCFGEVAVFKAIDHTLAACANALSVPYYFGYVATNFDHLHHLCQNGACEVYLGEDICFDLVRARRVCDDYKVRIRTFPNVAQSSVRTGPDHKKFFIRPEDIEEYSDVIDVIEFWGDLNKQAIFHRIYKRGRWFGELKEIIADLNIEFDSRCIVPVFANVRKTCGRKCMKGDSCRVCDSILSISRKLGDMNLIFKKKKE